MTGPVRKGLWRLRVVLPAFALAVLGAVDPVLSSAQSFPDRPVTLVVPFPPGGAADMLARLLSEGLTEHWDQPVVLDYRAGAGTIVGADYVAKATPDGYTLGIVVTSFVINAAVRHDLPYDSTGDFRGVTQIGEAPVVLLAHPDFPADSVDELIATAHSGRAAYAVPGIGTATHMAGEMLERAAGIDLLAVPYAGLAQALPDVLSGRVPLLFDIWHSARPHVEAGHLKVLAVASRGGVPDHPDFESLPDRFPGYAVSSIQGVVAPAGTPDDRIAKIAAAMRSVILSPAFAARMKEFGMEGVGSSPAEFDRLLAAEIGKWTRVAQNSGIAIGE